MLLLPYSGKAHDLYFRHYTNKQGLSHNTVYCALQDKKGFMWFGTDDGLNRFDGHQFRIYRYNSYDPESLPNDRIISLFEDSTGRIWVCTYSHTCYYDYQTDAFHPLTFSDSNNTPEYFQQIREDKKGNLWLMSYNRIARYALSGESSPHFYPEGEQISLIDITMDEENEPILAGRSDLFFYKPEADSPGFVSCRTGEYWSEQTGRDSNFTIGTVGTRKRSSRTYKFATSSSAMRILTGSHPNPVSIS